MFPHMSKTCLKEQAEQRQSTKDRTIRPKAFAQVNHFLVATDCRAVAFLYNAKRSQGCGVRHDGNSVHFPRDSAAQSGAARSVPSQPSFLHPSLQGAYGSASTACTQLGVQHPGTPCPPPLFFSSSMCWTTICDRKQFTDDFPSPYKLHIT